MAKKLVKILSLDGGGIRGVISGMILAEIERKTGKHTSELFDLIAGTSTGGIMALALTVPDEDGKPRHTAEEMVNYYEEDCHHIFTSSFFHKLLSVGNFRTEKYPPDGRAKMTKKYLANANLKDALTEVLVTSFEIETSRPFFFKRSDARKNEYLNFSMGDAAEATSAAPIYFKPYVIDKPKDPLVRHYVFVDGGVVANNPSMCAYVEAKTLFPEADDFLVLSLGTGEYAASVLIESMKRWGTVDWLKPLIGILLDGGGDIADHQLRTLLTTSGDQLNHYYRLQMRLQANEVPFDDASKIKFHILRLLTENFIKDNRKLIDEICDKLV